MLPGSSPFKELVESLRRVAVTELGGADQDLLHGRTTLVDLVQSSLPDGGTLVLIVDQFEEIFTLAPESEQRAFLDCLADAVTDPRGRVRVIATLRADFYDRPLAFRRFGALVDDATIAVAALSPAALESAIVGPVTAIGADADPSLVAELVATVADQPAALPSLQFTLFELAERRADRSLTLEDYRQLGGVGGAISSRAEMLYLSMDDTGRAAIRAVFERLVLIGPDGEVTGRRTSRASLSSGHADALDEVIDRWTEARLLTTDTDPHSRLPTVQLAHEAILKSWPRLGSWIDEDRAAIVTAGHLRDAAQSWHDLDRDNGALYRGARLEQALEAVDTATIELGPLEQEFLVASRGHRDDEERAGTRTCRPAGTHESAAAAPARRDRCCARPRAGRRGDRVRSTPQRGQRNVRWHSLASSPRPPRRTSSTTRSRASCSPWRRSKLPTTRCHPRRSRPYIVQSALRGSCSTSRASADASR